MYKLTNAIARAFFMLNIGTPDGPKHFDGWVYGSAEFKDKSNFKDRQDVVNIALLPKALKKIKLLSVSHLEGDKIVKVLHPCENGKLKILNSFLCSVFISWNLL